jgi:iron complex transport system substrate-binding protein
MSRIVSLIPSATEIVCALGFESELVGRSHECDYPPSVRDLPALTEPKFDVSGSSKQIDERVKNVLRDALSVYRVDEKKLNELKPDIIVTQAQCEVCAVSLNEVERVTRECLDTPARIVSLEPMQIADVFADVLRVAAALGAPERGAALVLELQARMDDIAKRAAALTVKPTVACVEWIDPLMAGGNWVPELAEMAGGIELFSKAGVHSPWMHWDELWAADPDVIVVLPCGFGIERPGNARPDAPARLENPARHPQWAGLPDRRQPVFQPPRSAFGRVAGNPRRNPAPRRLPPRSRRDGLGEVCLVIHPPK